MTRGGGEILELFVLRVGHNKHVENTKVPNANCGNSIRITSVKF